MISFGAVKLKLYKIEKLPHVCPLSNTHGQNSGTPSFCKLIESSCEWSSQILISIRLSSSLKKSFYSIYIKAPLLWSTKIPPPKKAKKNTTSKHQPWTEWEQPAFWLFGILPGNITGSLLHIHHLWSTSHLLKGTKDGRDTCVHTLWWSKETLALYNLGTTTWLFHHGSYWIQYSCKLMFGIFYGQFYLYRTYENQWHNLATA